MYIMSLGVLTTDLDTKDVASRGPIIVPALTPTYSLNGANEYQGGVKFGGTGYRYPNISTAGSGGGSLLNRGLN